VVLWGRQESILCQNDFSSGAYTNKAFQHRENDGGRSSYSFTVKEFREEKKKKMLPSKDLRNMLFHKKYSKTKIMTTRYY